MDETKDRVRPEQFVLRLPRGLRDRVKRQAEHNRRSMNAEIIVHVEKGVEQQEKQGTVKGAR